jgi:Fe-S cluster assembly protein SufD
MITEQEQYQATFQALLQQHYLKNAPNDPLQKIKAKAWDRLQELGLPTRRTEVFRYLRLRNLFSQNYALSTPGEISADAIALHVYPECTGSLLVFVNGHYQPTLSNTTALPQKLVISTLDDAMRTYGTLLNNQWAKFIKEETDPFTMINAALHRNGIFLYVPPKTIVEAPIQILHLIDTQNQPLLLLPRLHLFTGTQSQISLISSQAVLSGSEYCFNQSAEFVIEEDSHVQYTQMTQNLAHETWHFDALRAILKRNSTLKTLSMTKGSATVRNDYRVALTGENCEASLNGLWILSGKNEAHTNVIIDHQAPHCRSMQLFKGVLDDFSRSSFEGKIYVRQTAQKTEAFQLNNNLLLSDRANADSKPNLEIFADDVKASHGATVGQLDEEQLFYLKTRGFSEVAAQNMLVQSYCKELLDKIPLASVVQQFSTF